jgi:succinate dehydrogenase / fumarate reductase cytochrome b subunit
MASSSVLSLFNSSIGKKVIMALTGLFLCIFLIIHVSGNFQLFKQDSGLAFNQYTVFMTTNPLIKTISYLLYATILFHAFKGLLLVVENKRARPIQYNQYNGNANSKWASRNMGLLGAIILFFIVIHMSDFWYQYKFGHIPYALYKTELTTGKLVEVKQMDADFKLGSKMEEMTVGDHKYVIVKDLYKEVKEEFKEWWLVLLYVVSMGAISFHLYHGFKSAFQSLGLNNRKYNGLIGNIGLWIFAIVIPVSFAAMPVYFFITK